MIIEGKAGSGKTTLMKHCAIRWAHTKSNGTREVSIGDSSNRLPFFEKELVVFIQKEHEGENLDETVMNAMNVSKREKHEAKQLLKEHPEKCFLFLDALDEFRNRKVIEEVFERASDSSTNITVTCRDGHPYLNNQMNSFTRHVKVVGFKPDDAANFVKRFMKGLVDDYTLCKEKTEKLCKHIQKGEFNKFYASPINCAFVCLLYSEGKVSDEELSSLTMVTLFTKQQNLLLKRECHKQGCSLKSAELTLKGIYQLGLHSLIYRDAQSWYSSDQLKEFDIDLASPEMVLLVKEKKSTVEEETDMFSWPHETVKEFHAANAFKGNHDMIYFIAAKPELNQLAQFLIPMIADTDLELAKTFLTAMFLLRIQSEEPQCASSKFNKLFGHCCCRIPELKNYIESVDLNKPFKPDQSGILQFKLNIDGIQQCVSKSGWLLQNYDKYAEIVNIINPLDPTEFHSVCGISP